MAPLLLDTNAAIFLARDDLNAAATAALDDAANAGVPTFVSAITAWEIGQLVSRKRLNLLMSPSSWFAAVTGAPGVRLAALTPEILIASSFLPGSAPRDPADRILVATARELGAQLVTRDRELIAYGRAGHFAVMPC